MVSIIKNFFSVFKDRTRSTDQQPVTEASSQDQVNGSDYIGAVCRVLNSENECYYVGQIESFDAASGELKIPLYRGEFIKKSTQYDAPVKIQIQSSSRVTMLYGTVRKQSREFWCVQLVNAVEHQDQREGFRQLIKGTASVQRCGASPAEKIPCELVDISMTGICFRCKEQFAAQERITVFDVLLYPDAPHSYTFPCVVSRSFTNREKESVKEDDTVEEGEEAEPTEAVEAVELQQPEDLETFYGCAFLPLSAEEHDQLYQDIFTLQWQERIAEL